MKKQLYCDSVHIGEIVEVIEHQNTYFGTIRLAEVFGSSPSEKRIRQFIDMLIEFNTLLEQSQNNVAEDSFLDDYTDLINRTEWSIEEAGEHIMLESAPNFISADEISYCVKGSGE